MNKTIVRCRCGHQVLSKEVLRTDLYERRAPDFGDASREYVYVKYRCRRCKRMGEAFVAESRWDWAMLEAEPNEMTDQERDRFLDEEPVSTEEIINFHRQLQEFSLLDLATFNVETGNGEVVTNEPQNLDAETREPTKAELARVEPTKTDAKSVAPAVSKPEKPSSLPSSSVPPSTVAPSSDDLPDKRK